MRRRGAWLPVWLVAVVVLVSLWTLDRKGGLPPTAAGPDATEEPVMRAPEGQLGSELAPPTRSSTTSRDFGYDPALAQEPTATQPQNKLWFADGTWWGVLANPESGQWHVYALDGTTQTWADTGTLVDERSYASSDVLWDGSRLYVVTGGSKVYAKHLARLLRFSYDPSTRRYTLDQGFPVALTAEGVRDLSIVKDSIGRLWAAYISDEQVLVNRSLGDDTSWGAPFPPPGGGPRVPATTAGLVAYDARIGLMWSNEVDGAFYFTSRADADPDDVWDPTTAAVQGPGYADDHLDLAAVETAQGWRVYAVVKTSLDTLPRRNPASAQILLLSLAEEGEWHRALVGRIQDRHTRPILLIDEEREEMYVVAVAPFGGGAIYYKRSPLHLPVFPTGLGVPFVTSDADPLVTNPTSTRQNLTSETGLVVLAADDSTGRYLHGSLNLGGEQPSPPGS